MTASNAGEVLDGIAEKSATLRKAG